MSDDEGELEEKKERKEETKQRKRRNPSRRSLSPSSFSSNRSRVVFTHTTQPQHSPSSSPPLPAKTGPGSPGGSSPDLISPLPPSWSPGYNLSPLHEHKHESPFSASASSSSNSSSLVAAPQSQKEKFNIAIVSDFFFPRLGGVELHQYDVAQGLIRLGHKVIIITGTYGPGTQRQGVRFLTNGLKVYYCPQMSIHSQASLPTFYSFFPLFRNIIIREQIQIIHGHQTTSALAHECIFHARTMGLKTVFTDHSLFGFNNSAAIHLNKLMKFTLSDIDHVICVSHCSKENLVLRAYLDPTLVSVIPNAVDTTKFTPEPTRAPDPARRINIVILSRLVYRKGVDLVVDVIPPICQKFPHVYFIIGGDGNKKLAIEEMREKHQLQDRVELLGAVAHTDVRNVLVRGHIFLNCSLTEAFCIAILEAVSCGLYVVSTKVGGVPEILPSDMISFADPVPEALIEKLCEAIPSVGALRPMELHYQVRKMYNWYDVAARTEKVYQSIIHTKKPTLMERLLKYHECGLWAGKIFSGIAALDYLLWRFLEWWQPSDEIDEAPAFNLDYYHEIKDKK